MSAHIWDNKTFAARTLDAALEEFKRAAAGGHSHHDACKWVGYALERARQTGLVSLKNLWDGGVRTGHKYLTGKNADNYWTAGAKMLALLGERYGLIPDCEPQVVWGWLADEKDVLHLGEKAAPVVPVVKVGALVQKLDRIYETGTVLAVKGDKVQVQWRMGRPAKSWVLAARVRVLKPARKAARATCGRR